MKKYLQLKGNNGELYTFEKVPYSVLKGKLHNYKVCWGEGFTLADVYRNYSYEKQKAYEYCRTMNYALKGEYGCILSHNKFMFTYAFIIHGETNYFVYITPTHNYICEL